MTTNRAVRWAVAAVLLALVGAGCGSGSTAGSYDVDAARACQALDVFVNDVKQQTASLPDSQSFAYTMARLPNGHGSTSKWRQLSADLTALVQAAGAGDFAGMAKQGQMVGAECDKIPRVAQVAGGFASATSTSPTSR